MVNIAIIEDEYPAVRTLLSHLKRFENGKDMFSSAIFSDPVTFLETYQGNYDIIFLDIELPNMDGLEMAMRLRKFDKNTIIIFVTNMAQYAVKGYSVNALDFIVKPVGYSDFAMKLKRALTTLESNEDLKILVNTEDGVVCLSSLQIRYVEVLNHKLVYYTGDGKYTAYSSLKKAEDILPRKSFVRCNNCYLINLRYVTTVRGYILDVDGTELTISRSKKKEFMQALADYLGGGARRV